LKLQEEVDEFLAEESEEEWADVIEVLEAFLEANGGSWGHIKKLKDEKDLKKGSFKKKVFLEYVDDNDGES
jgi:predicted house-cleaning noncanonical NTP pyrophosphatase (MazG superfamily)